MFRSLQQELPVHKSDVQHCVDYCDNEGSLDLDLDNFIRAVCGHQDLVTQSRVENTVTKETDLSSQKSVLVLDGDRIRSSKTCIKIDSFHQDTKLKFMEILNKQFKQVPSHPDLFFFCPPGMDVGGAHKRVRKRNETRSSEGTSKNYHSGSSGKIRTDDDEEDRTIEFRSELSEGSVKKLESTTDAETNVRDGHSNMSMLSNLETDDMEDHDDDDDEDDDEPDEFSPPLFIQFSLAITQDKEDIVCAPIQHLPTCLAEILQDDSIPDPEQDLDIESLGLRLDLVCMTLPKQLDSLTENFGSLRSTSMCSSASQPSNSLSEDDLDDVDSIEEDLHSGSDVLAHLPEYQHRAVLQVLEEMKWMLRDEIAFALTKTLPLSQPTLEFIRNHVQSSVEHSGSNVETVDLNFVFGTQLSLDRFKENFQTIQVQGFVLREVGDFYYLDVDEASATAVTHEEARSRSRGRDEKHHLSPVKEATTPVYVDNDFSDASLDSSTNTADDEGSETTSEIDLGEVKIGVKDISCIMNSLSCIFQVDWERVNMFIHFRDNNPQIKNTWRLVHQELLAAVKNICIHVNQSLLLNDLYDRRTCNRLLEQEKTDDIFFDPSRHQQHELEEDDSPYLEANLSVKFSPGQFKCPEVWETRFIN